MRSLHIILLIILLPVLMKAQKDFQIEVDTPHSRLQVMLNDNNPASPTYGLGSWELVDSVRGAFQDHDFYGYGTGAAPLIGEDSIETATDSMSVLFKGKYQGIPANYEFMAEGILRFDYTNESSGETKIYQIIEPVQQSQGNVPWISSIFTAANYGARWNDVHSEGWNLEGSNVWIPAKHGFGHVTEGFYQQDATHLRFEDHTIYYGTDGIQWRPESLVITDGIVDEWYKYMTVSNFQLLDPRNTQLYADWRTEPSDTSFSYFTMWSPNSSGTKGAQFAWSTTNNRLAISPFGTSNTTFDVNGFPYSRHAMLQRTAVASSIGQTMEQIAGNSTDGYFGNIYPRFGLSLVNDTLRVDTTDLPSFHYVDSIVGTVASDVDWLESGATPPNNDADEMYHTGDVHVGDNTMPGGGKLNVYGRLDLRFPDNGIVGSMAIGNGAGNASMTGANNIIIGKDAGTSITTGNQNITLGNSTLTAVTDEAFNIAIGSEALMNSTESNSVAIGYQALKSATTGTGLLAIGDQAAEANTDGTNNAAIGATALQLNTTGDRNVAIGVAALGAMLDANDNTVIGAVALQGDAGPANTIIGSLAASSAAADVWDNTVIGYLAGENLTGGGNVFIGKHAGRNETGSNFLYIDNSSATTPLLKGDFSADTLLINGALSIGTVAAGASTDSVLVWNASTKKVRMRDAGDFTDTDDQNLTIEGAGPTYDIAINDGTDVTIQGGGIVTLSESPANTLVITATEVGTMSNWLLAASGTGGTETVTTGETVTFSETTGLDATRSTNTVSYALSIDEFSTDAALEGDELGLVYDPSGVNHELVDVSEYLNVIEEGNVSVQADNMNIDFQTMFDVAADGAGEVNVSFDGGEASTVTLAQTDDYVMMYDAGTLGMEKVLWDDLHESLIEFYDGAVSQGSGNAIDVGEGLDINVVGFEGNINLDASEFQVDGTAEGTEYVLIHDTDTTAGHQIQRRLVSSFSGGTDTNFAEDDLTFTGNRTHDMDIYSMTLTGTATNVYIQEENGGTGNMLVLVSELGAGTGITGGISFQSENGGTPTEQYDVESYKWSTNQSTFTISGEQATDAEINFEKNADLSNNTTESHVSINGGFAITQNYDGSTGGSSCPGGGVDLNLDRSYYYVNITGGLICDTIKLPEVAQVTDNWSSSLTSTQCQVGQEYVITNARSAVNLVIGAYNPAGTSDDLIGTRTAPGGSAGSAISIAPGKSVIVKCYQLAGGIGYWNYWLSN